MLVNGRIASLKAFFRWMKARVERDVLGIDVVVNGAGRLVVDVFGSAGRSRRFCSYLGWQGGSRMRAKSLALLCHESSWTLDRSL